MTPECGSCKDLAADYQKITTAENLAGRKLKFAYVDASTDEGKAFMAEHTGDV